MPVVGRAPSTRGRIWAEEALLGYQILLSIHKVSHVIIFQQRAVEGAVQGAGRAQVLILGRRVTAWQPLPSPVFSLPRKAQEGARSKTSQARIGLGGPGTQESFHPLQESA